MADSVLLAGAGARIKFSIGAANHAVGPVTYAIVIKRTAASTWDTLMGDWDGGFSDRLGLSDSNTLFATIGGTDSLSSVSVGTSTDWMLVAMTKASGTVAPRFHHYNGSTWAHGNGLTSVANGPTMADFDISESGGDVFAGNVLIFGIADTAFSDGAIEALADGYQAWQDAAFTEGVRCDAATGLASWGAGSMAQTSATGVSLDAGDAPTWWDDTLGGTPQIVLPDADTDAAGWTTTPLFSKVNDASDSTFITDGLVV